MNVIVVPESRKGFYCRPDSTLLRAISDYYIPDYVSELSVSPVFIIKTLRAGKSISAKFALRYIDSFNYGLLLHPVINKKKGELNPFIENSLDYTSIIPLESFPYNDDNLKKYLFSIEIDYKEAYNNITPPSSSCISETIAEISTYCSLRIGDFIAMEMAPAKKISAGGHLLGTLNNNQLFEFGIK